MGVVQILDGEKENLTLYLRLVPYFCVTEDNLHNLFQSQYSQLLCAEINISL